MTAASSDDYTELEQMKVLLNNRQLTPDVQEVINVLFWKLEAVLKERDDLIMAENLRGTLLMGQHQITPNTHLLETLRRENQTATPSPTGKKPSHLFLTQELHTPTCSTESSPTTSITIDNDLYVEEEPMSTTSKDHFMKHGPAPTPSSPTKTNLFLGHYRLTTPTDPFRDKILLLHRLLLRWLPNYSMKMILMRLREKRNSGHIGHRSSNAGEYRSDACLKYLSGFFQKRC
ncbi:hypothetical protein WDU94_004978 [Cyamophila willieti]